MMMRSRVWAVRRIRDPKRARASVIENMALMHRSVHSRNLIVPPGRSRAARVAAPGTDRVRS